MTKLADAIAGLAAAVLAATGALGADIALVHPRPLVGYDPDWSTDTPGRWLAFTAAVDPTNGATLATTDVFLLDTSTGSYRNVSAEAGLPSGANERYTSLSGDARFVVFVMAETDGLERVVWLDRSTRARDHRHERRCRGLEGAAAPSAWRQRRRTLRRLASADPHARQRART
ncbi:MAG TPA: hypothetical protein VEL07_02000 [Planctomycetota bacterium]|nr:hypothetical protein [Planctomycetota bacterium]